MSLFNDLKKRGLIHQVTSEKVAELLDGTSFSFYCGFDPTADSLHVGSLLPLITMKRLQNHGHKPILLMGKSTALIGDPSFKAQERKLLTPDIVDSNIQGISQNIKNIIDCEVVANDWFNSMSVLEFLRDVGKHISVNNMLSKDSVKTRLEDREQGISFTEFSYMLLQGQDFRVLFKNKNCIMQIGGRDQWSNILVGTSLIRKELNQEAFGLTLPLLLKSDGTKFGKSENGNIWLSEEKTSVFDFFQFFLNVADSDVIDLLKKMTFLSLEEITTLEESLRANPESRLAQKALAKELTVLVHGESKFQEALNQTQKLFSKKDFSSSQGDLILPSSEVIGKPLVDLLVISGLSTSKTAARKDIQGGGIYLESAKVLDATRLISHSDLVNSRLVLRKGKSNYKIIEVKD